jgi:hypothetical protein
MFNTKNIFMRKYIGTAARSARAIVFVTIAGTLINLIQGCSCPVICMFDSDAERRLEKIYRLPENSLNEVRSQMSLFDLKLYSRDLKPSWVGTCEDYCKALVEKDTSYMRVMNAVIQAAVRIYGTHNQSVTNEAPAGDTITSIGDPVPQKNEPGQIDNNTAIKFKSPFPVSGEYLSTTITAGGTTSFVSKTETYGPETSPPGFGVHVGIGTAMPLPGNFGLSTAIRFKQLNGVNKLDYSSPGGGYSEVFETEYKYNLVSANLMARYHIGKNFSVTAGPEINYLVSAHTINEGKKENIKDDSNNFGVDMLAGVKYEFSSGDRKPKWGVSLIYDHGISRLNKKKMGGFDMPEKKMKSVQLGISYFICNSCNKR